MAPSVCGIEGRLQAEDGERGDAPAIERNSKVPTAVDANNGVNTMWFRGLQGDIQGSTATCLEVEHLLGGFRGSPAAHRTSQ